MKTPPTREEALVKWQNMVKKKAERRKRVGIARIMLATTIAVFFAVLFLMPTILTVTNSFMSSSEISSNYGQVFATSDTGGKVFIAGKVNIKFIPDMVSFSQYITVLFMSPDYLIKFWNSVWLVVPIVIFQLVLATLAAYGFTRYRGRVKELIFFFYIILMLM
ncbi:MAG: carbohydrate ABC transporter permease, partial [Lachnospiraceae bacterium]|nr:carbohydrate ABC transporter permease [Lachnospiraceae bacterium]